MSPRYMGSRAPRACLRGVGYPRRTCREIRVRTPWSTGSSSATASSRSSVTRVDEFCDRAMGATNTPEDQSLSTRAARRSTPSFAHIWRNREAIVAGARFSSAAISLFTRPRATSSAICCSRGLSRSRALGIGTGPSRFTARRVDTGGGGTGALRGNFFSIPEITPKQASP
jgi:hypothetical protein